jgi:hypothetical protein
MGIFDFRFRALWENCRVSLQVIIFFLKSLHFLLKRLVDGWIFSGGDKVSVLRRLNKMINFEPKFSYASLQLEIHNSTYTGKNTIP